MGFLRLNLSSCKGLFFGGSFTVHTLLHPKVNCSSSSFLSPGTEGFFRHSHRHRPSLLMTSSGKACVLLTWSCVMLLSSSISSLRAIGRDTDLGTGPGVARPPRQARASTAVSQSAMKPRASERTRELSNCGLA